MAQIIPLGVVTAAAGTSVPLIPLSTQSLYPDGFNSIMINPIPGATGPVYICNNTTVANTTTYGNVAFVVPATTSPVIISSSGQVNDNGPSGLFVSAPTTGQGVLVTVKRS
jgi:hypothetical protein